MLIRIKHGRQSDYKGRVNERKKLSGGRFQTKRGERESLENKLRRTNLIVLQTPQK